MNFYELLLNRGQPSGEGMTHFERLFAAKLAGGGGEIKELEGVPPLLFKANGEPLIDWSIYGNTVQSGTPTPQNPIQPQETGERTENLCPNTGWQLGQYSNGVWDTTTPNRITSPFFAVEEDNQYTITINNGTILSFININYFDSQKTWLGNRATLGMAQFSTASQKETTPNMPVGSAYMKITVRPYNNIGDISLSDIPISNIMSNEGSTALPYEPYGYKIPISSANTTTPVYLGEVQTTRRIKKLVLTGEEGWVRTSNEKCYYINSAKGCPADYLKSNIVAVMCSHYEGQRNTSSGSNEVNEGCICFFTGGGFELYIGERTITSAENFKTYLQQQYANGTPVTVWYVLATPTTGIVNEPLMKIGDYADSLTATQAGVEIPTIKGNNTLDIDTTVKPSKVYIKYKD